MEEKTSKLQVINRDMLKLIAIIPMTIGHFCGYLSEGALYEDMPFAVFVLMHLALFAPPIFFFFIAEGYRHTRSKRKYALRIFGVCHYYANTIYPCKCRNVVCDVIFYRT